jgi:hypothetical protein
MTLLLFVTQRVWYYIGRDIQPCYTSRASQESKQQSPSYRVRHCRCALSEKLPARPCASASIRNVRICEGNLGKTYSIMNCVDAGKSLRLVISCGTMVQRSHPSPCGPPPHCKLTLSGDPCQAHHCHCDPGSKPLEFGRCQ